MAYRQWFEFSSGNLLTGFSVALAFAFSMASCGSEPKVVVDAPTRGLSMGDGSIIYVDIVGGDCGGQKPCEHDIQTALNAAVDGDVVALVPYSDESSWYHVSSVSPDLPPLTISSAITLTSAAELPELLSGKPPLENGDCPFDRSACPTIYIEGTPRSGVEIQSDGVTISNIWFYQPGVPGSDQGGQIIDQPVETLGPTDKPNEGYELYDDLAITEVGVEGGRLGIQISGSDMSVVASLFQNNFTSAIKVSTAQGKTNIQSNQFSNAGSSTKKAVLLEAANQYQPLTSGTITVLDNTATGKANFFVWDAWNMGPTTLEVSHNTLVSQGSQAISFYVIDSTFDNFAAISFADNLVTGSGGTAVYVDFAFPGNAPDVGQIQVSNLLSFDNTATPDSISEGTGSYGLGGAATPIGAGVQMYTVTDLIDGQEAKDNPNLDLVDGVYELGAGSPAIGAGTDGTNIGAWQGADAPRAYKLSPRCGPAGTQVRIKGKDLSDVTSVKFGGKSAEIVKPKGKKPKKNSVEVIAPAGTLGDLVDVTVQSSAGTFVLRDGYTYTAGKNKCTKKKDLAELEGN
jgi:hypothetical protein